MSIESALDFGKQCILVADRYTATELLKTNSHFFIAYLDIVSGYPQIKFIASEQRYSEMDEFFESFDRKTTPFFAIHDNYSNYPTHNDTTYTIPLTKGNFEVIKLSLQDKPGFEAILGKFEQLNSANLTINLDEHDGEGVRCLRIIADYADWSSEDHLYSLESDIEVGFMDKLRTLQRGLLSDPTTPLFIDDHGTPVLNDLITTDLEPETIDWYLKRYQDETNAIQKKQAKEKEQEHTLLSRRVPLCAVLTDGKDSSIYDFHQLRAYQCRNEVYKTITQSSCFKEHLRRYLPPILKDKFLIPTQEQLIELIHYPSQSKRWSILRDVYCGDFDPDVSAWQAKVYYEFITPELSERLKILGYEQLATAEYANQLVILPMEYFELLVLYFNLQKYSHDSEFILPELLNKINEINSASPPKPLPRSVIDGIGKISSLDVSQWLTNNEMYYNNNEHLLIMERSLRSLQAQISLNNCNNRVYFCAIFDRNSKSFIHIKLGDLLKSPFPADDKYFPLNKNLIHAIKTLENPLEFTLDWMEKSFADAQVLVSTQQLSDYILRGHHSLYQPHEKKSNEEADLGAAWSPLK